MQEYTSLETSRKLFEMFGWSDTYGYYYYKSDGVYGSQVAQTLAVKPGWWHFSGEPANDTVPIYSLPYLLDKLPVSLLVEKAGGKIHSRFMLERLRGGKWSAIYPGRHDISIPSHESVVEEAALLCLELGERGILPGKDSDGNK